MENKIIKGNNFDCLKLSGGGILCSLKGDISNGVDFFGNENKIRISGYKKCSEHFNSFIYGNDVPITICEFDGVERGFIPSGMAEHIKIA